VPARLRSLTMRPANAWSVPVSAPFLGRPGERRVRMNAIRSSGKIAQTVPTLIPYSRCLSSNRRT
jgi:hypothetical protein